jgi:thiosulfate/3-mercaptopyruvate sulfurtransferase
MKNIKAFLFCTIALLASNTLLAQNPVNWTGKELMEPAALAKNIKDKKGIPLIISIGPGALIPHSVDIGPANDTANLQAFQKELAGKKKNTKVVVYCGCCPFDKCPNVRPAVQALKDAGFANYYVLNLKTNLKTDWIDKGYPTVK